MRRTDPTQYPSDPDQPVPESLRFEDRPWESPGPPPWERNSQRPSGLVVWIVVALALLVLGVIVAGVLVSGEDAKPVPEPVMAQVEVTGECRANIVGRYSVLATVTVHNATSTEQRGTVYARWPVTGAEPLVFAEQWTLAPGQTRSLHVDEPVRTERWYRLEACDRGWSVTGVPSP